MDLYPVCMCSVICFSMSYVWYGQSRIEPYHYCFMHIVWMANRRINRESKIQVPISELIIHSHKHDDEKQNYFAIDNNLSCWYTSVTHTQLVCVTLSLSYQNCIILSDMQSAEVRKCVSLIVRQMLFSFKFSSYLLFICHTPEDITTCVHFYYYYCILRGIMQRLFSLCIAFVIYCISNQHVVSAQ